MNSIERFNLLRVELPIVYNDIDKLWISTMLRKLDILERKKAVNQYVEDYEAAYKNENINHKKQNVAGRAANTGLRLYVNKCLLRRNQTVSKPPILSAA